MTTAECLSVRGPAIHDLADHARAPAREVLRADDRGQRAPLRLEDCTERLGDLVACPGGVRPAGVASPPTTAHSPFVPSVSVAGCPAAHLDLSRTARPRRRQHFSGRWPAATSSARSFLRASKSTLYNALRLEPSRSARTS